MKTDTKEWMTSVLITYEPPGNDPRGQTLIVGGRQLKEPRTLSGYSLGVEANIADNMGTRLRTERHPDMRLELSITIPNNC